MKCPICQSPTEISDSEEINNIVKRKRKCLKCGNEFMTFEEIQEPINPNILKVIKVQSNWRKMFEK